MSYIEEGAFIIHNNEQLFIMVSPNGSIGRQDLETTYEGPTPILTCEFKCPFHNENTVPVHYDIPLRYIPQILERCLGKGKEKTSRENILNAFVSIPIVRKVETDLVSMKSSFGSLSVSCPLYAKLINAFRKQTNNSQTNSSHSETGDSSDNIEEVTDDGKIDAFSSLPDDALDIFNDNDSFSTAFITDIMGTSEIIEGASITQEEQQPAQDHN
ncbi:unnamed protein product [Mytilus coruscus]|uniref:Uncharacterized protein n=1 Tax=Mytilus coruscus TaxID=42192 RepID=A0A6J8BU10_MYTCO|nr:unnamed protein product [Mytilus coruscus]